MYVHGIKEPVHTHLEQRLGLRSFLLIAFVRVNKLSLFGNT